MGQAPQPLLNPPISPESITSATNYGDQAVDIGLYEAQGDGLPGNPEMGQLVPRKVYVLGTKRDATGNYISISRYGPNGYNPAGLRQPEMQAFWPEYDPMQFSTGGARAAKAIVIPVVPWTATEQDVRIFVLGVTDGPFRQVGNQFFPTTDIVVLCYNGGLKLRWSQTYNFQGAHGFEGDDLPIAITTDQSNDVVVPGNALDYNFVAVLGKSQTISGAFEAVTMAYCKNSGQPIMSPVRESGMPSPVDIAAVNSLSGFGCSSRVVITGGTAGAYTLGQIMTQAYYVTDFACGGLSTLSGPIAGWPHYRNGSFNGWAYPSRIKYFKGLAIVAGTTGILGDLDAPPRSDFLTFADDLCTVPSPSSTVWSNQWAVPEAHNTPTPRRAAFATDMDVVWGNINTQAFTVVTGRATSRVDDRTAVATIAYDANRQRVLAQGCALEQACG